MTIYTVGIDTNEIDLEKYQVDLEAIYAKYLTNLPPDPREHVGRLIVPAAFDLADYSFYAAGQYVDITPTGRVEVPAVTQESFYEYVSEIVSSEHAFPFTISRAIVLDDPQAGYGVHLIPDKFAAAALTRLHHKLFDGRLGDEMDYERGNFIANAKLLWASVPKEAMDSFVNAINDLPMEISGYIDTIEIAEWDWKQQKRNVLKSFRLPS